ncbi:MAG: nucleoside 2-deoxyribosyltransferase [Cyanobacteria bacterium]|nr:nucleoside 2-deoxyribosyltransferase [Cyanobacteriota bacterium]MDW8202044.1 nucleoside 2-deoxyribosyltransferase [Cyanobacteriota bacterium SKYGB_h_bin112]
MTLPPWIYLAGPLFTQAEITFNRWLAAQLRSAGYTIYLPQEECSGVTDPQELFAICMKGLDRATLAIVILDGADADSGSCFEMGYAYGRGLPIIGLRTDFRGSGEHMGVNLMLTHSCTHLILTSTNPPPSTDTVTYLAVGEDVVSPLVDVLKRLVTARSSG